MAGNYPIKPGENISLSRALGLSRGEIISLVGGGGKSTLMKLLALELANAGHKVIATTTTHILPDQAIGYFILEENKKLLLDNIQKAIISNPILTVTCGQEPNGKLKGPDPGVIPELLRFTDFVIVEADGAQRKPLKAPNNTEPVIVPETNVVIAIAGIDGIGKKFRDIVFRYEIASRLTGLAPEDIVTTQAVATLLAHPEGITRTSPPQSRKIAFINKVEDEKEMAFALEIANSLKKHALFNHVIIGCLEGNRPSIRLIQIN